MKKKIICLADRLLWMILLCGGLFSACRSEKEDPVEKEPEVPATPYITKVLEFCPVRGSLSMCCQSLRRATRRKP